MIKINITLRTLARSACLTLALALLGCRSNEPTSAPPPVKEPPAQATWRREVPHVTTSPASPLFGVLDEYLSLAPGLDGTLRHPIYGSREKWTRSQFEHFPVSFLGQDYEYVLFPDTSSIIVDSDGAAFIRFPNMSTDTELVERVLSTTRSTR